MLGMFWKFLCVCVSFFFVCFFVTLFKTNASQFRLCLFSHFLNFLEHGVLRKEVPIICSVEIAKCSKGVGSKLLWIRKKMTSLHGFLLEGAGTGNARISGLKLEWFLIGSVERRFGVVEFLIACLYYLDQEYYLMNPSWCGTCGAGTSTDLCIKKGLCWDWSGASVSIVGYCPESCLGKAGLSHCASVWAVKPLSCCHSVLFFCTCLCWEKSLLPVQGKSWQYWGRSLMDSGTTSILGCLKLIGGIKVLP